MALFGKRKKTEAQGKKFPRMYPKGIVLKDHVFTYLCKFVFHYVIYWIET